MGVDKLYYLRAILTYILHTGILWFNTTDTAIRYIYTATGCSKLYASYNIPHHYNYLYITITKLAATYSYVAIHTLSAI